MTACSVVTLCLNLFLGMSILAAYATHDSAAVSKDTKPTAKQKSTDPRTERNILLYLGDGFEALEAVAIMEACFWTAYCGTVPEVRLTTTGDQDIVSSGGGLFSITVDVPVRKVKAADYDALAIPGCYPGNKSNPHLYDLVRAIHSQGGIIVTGCIGIHVVAEAGLLKGKKITSRGGWRDDRLRKCGAIIEKAPIVVDDRIISTLGPAQSLDAALLMLDMIIGRKASAKVKNWMPYPT